MKTASRISCIFAGLVFIFSGFVKAVDPTGFAIKFTEYFGAFHLGFLSAAAMPLAILVCAAEFMIGMNLLAAFRMKFTAWLLLAFMSFFTVLTLVLALTNPVSDCGCFGDALKLTNWQTFGKNVILLVPTIILFLQRKKIRSAFSPAAEWAFVAFNLLLPVMISVYCLRHQPLIDFRPYSVGTYIPGKMEIPEGAEPDRYETRLIYEKDGRRQEFTETDFPWQDSTWKWVETRQNLIKKGYEPPIHDFSVTTPEGEDITERILGDSLYVFLILAPDLEKASGKGMARMDDLALKCRESGISVYCLTSSADSRISDYTGKHQPAFDICATDETTLKTMMRANPGLMLLHRGTILGKWNYRDAPEPASISQDMLPFILQKQHRRSEALPVIALALAVALFYCIAFRFRR